MATNRFSPQERYIPDYLRASHESLNSAMSQARAIADSTKTTTTTTERDAQQGAGLGASIGGAIGSIAGSYFGPAGTMVGGMLGGAIGGAIDGGGVGAAEGGAQGLGTGMAMSNSDAFSNFKMPSSSETLNAANGMSGAINLSNNGSNGGKNISSVRDTVSQVVGDQWKVGSNGTGHSYYDAVSADGLRKGFADHLLGGFFG